MISIYKSKKLIHRQGVVGTFPTHDLVPLKANNCS